MAVSVRSAWGPTSRPSPVAPPVTMATRPLKDSGVRWGWGRSCTAGADAERSPPPDDQGKEPEGLKESEPMAELEHRQAASQLRPRETAVYSRLGSRLRARCRRIRRAGAGS